MCITAPVMDCCGYGLMTIVGGQVAGKELLVTNGLMAWSTLCYLYRVFCGIQDCCIKGKILKGILEFTVYHAVTATCRVSGSVRDTNHTMPEGHISISSPK